MAISLEVNKAAQTRKTTSIPLSNCTSSNALLNKRGNSHSYPSVILSILFSKTLIKEDNNGKTAIVCKRNKARSMQNLPDLKPSPPFHILKQFTSVPCSAV